MNNYRKFVFVWRSFSLLTHFIRHTAHILFIGIGYFMTLMRKDRGLCNIFGIGM